MRCLVLYKKGGSVWAQKLRKRALGALSLVVCSLVFASCGSQPVERKASAGLGHASVSQGASVVAVPRLLAQAAELRRQHKLREAEIVITRAQQAEADNPAVWQALLALQLEIAEVALEALPQPPYARGAGLVEVAKQLERARFTLNGIRGVSIQPVSKVDPKVVVESETAFSATETLFRSTALVFCESRIKAARALRAEAHHWVVKNDRTVVVNGLKELRWVEALAPYADDEVRGSVAGVLEELKSLVSDEEWVGLRARAGFDPNSSSVPK